VTARLRCLWTDCSVIWNDRLRPGILLGRDAETLDKASISISLKFGKGWVESVAKSRVRLVGICATGLSNRFITSATLVKTTSNPIWLRSCVYSMFICSSTAVAAMFSIVSMTRTIELQMTFIYVD
ncbi:set and mynd domain-containing protein 3, partial [Moniliophthora roreri]